MSKVKVEIEADFPDCIYCGKCIKTDEHFHVDFTTATWQAGPHGNSHGGPVINYLDWSICKDCLNKNKKGIEQRLIGRITKLIPKAIKEGIKNLKNQKR